MNKDNKVIDLNVATPEDVVKVLRQAANEYLKSSKDFTEIKNYEGAEIWCTIGNKIDGVCNEIENEIKQKQKPKTQIRISEQSEVKEPSFWDRLFGDKEEPQESFIKRLLNKPESEMEIET